MPVSISLNKPDESFRLSPAERANISRQYDPDALEQLLRQVQPEHRMEILAHFQIEPFDGKRRGNLVEIFDPVLDSLLDPVWAPLWQNATDEQVEAEFYGGLRGRATVLKRRQEMRDNPSSH